MHSARTSWIPLFALSTAACVVVVDDDWNASGLHRHRPLRGSGVRAEIDRPVGEFRAIELGVPATVRVEVGGTPALRLAGDDDLLPKVETEVENGVLSIELDEPCDFRCGLEVLVSVPQLERFEIEGSGEVSITGLSGEKAELAIEGSGTLSASGSAGHLIGSIEGSGDLRLAGLAAEQAELSIEGSGSMAVRVVQELSYSIEGSGSILYDGEPRVSGRIEGSGAVERRR
jgi:hypothetical protein